MSVSPDLSRPTPLSDITGGLIASKMLKQSSGPDGLCRKA